MSASSSHPPPRALAAYARFVVRRPWAVIGIVLATLTVSVLGALHLRINTNQLDLISQDLPEVKEVKRVIDMVGGSGYLTLALRGSDEATLKKVADDLNAQLVADKEHVRFVSYKLPVEFIQNNMVLFIKTEDLAEGKRRIMAFLKDQLRRNNPFFVELKKTEPVKLELQDLVDKYGSVGKRSIMDEYNISRDGKMLLLLIKPMWDGNDLGKTKAFVETLDQRLAEYGQKSGVKLVEDYSLVGDKTTVAYGYTGSYKLAVDDSYAVEHSLRPTGPVTLAALAGIFLITILFFRRLAPTVLVVTGTVMGTLMTMGFAYFTLGELNMITSVLAGILMGFGIDYGIHFIFRTRLELGAGKKYDEAIHDALINAGRPAFVSAVVTAGSFAVLMVSEFRGFSQFGFLAAMGTFLIAFTLFSWTPALLMVLGRRNAELPRRLVGTMAPPPVSNARGEIRVPRPGMVLGVASVVVAALCALAIPWSSKDPGGDKLGFFERMKHGVRFNYNTRALIPDDQYSVKLQDEINKRFQISSDPVAVYTKDLAETKELYEELTKNKHKYPSVDQVVSIYTFVPPPDVAAANAKILEEWQAELSEIDPAALPPQYQDKAQTFFKMLSARPFDVNGVPQNYKEQFQHLPTTRPENHGYLTFLYPAVDLWNGKTVMNFADELRTIKTDGGKEFHAAGAPMLYARLSKIVLKDGQLTVLLAALWILVMHYLDFRNVKLALASVIPLGVGLVMMMGIMVLTDHKLNFMNIIILPILLGFGVSHGLYLLHRFLEGTSPMVALRSVGAAVSASTLTAIAGFAALGLASHNGLKSMGYIATIGLLTTLVVSFTVLAAVLQLMHDERAKKNNPEQKPLPDEQKAA